MNLSNILVGLKLRCQLSHLKVVVLVAFPACVHITASNWTKSMQPARTSHTPCGSACISWTGALTRVAVSTWKIVVGEETQAFTRYTVIR